MTFRSWIRKILGMSRRASASTAPSGRRGAARRRPRWQPTLEVLEDRLVPASFVVSDTGDSESDTDSLRYAIEHLGSGGNTITFAPNLAGQTINLLIGGLEIDHDVTINGLAAAGQPPVAVSGDNTWRVFNIQSGTTVNISYLTIENGRAFMGDGGAIYNGGTLTLQKSTVTGSTSIGSSGTNYNHQYYGGYGGGIYNHGALTVEQSTIANNTAQGGNGTQGESGGGGGGGGGGGFGGGIFSYFAGSCTLVDSTVTGNTAVGGKGADGVNASLDDTGYGGTGADTGCPGATASYPAGATLQNPGGGYVGGGGSGGGGGFGIGVFGANKNGGPGGFGGGGGGGGAYTGTGTLGHSFAPGGSSDYGGDGGQGGNNHSNGGYSGGGGGGAGIGGGIYSQSHLTITASTIADNHAVGGPGGKNGGGAGEGGSAGEGVAGGIFMWQQDAILDSTIVAGNTAGGPGGGVSGDTHFYGIPSGAFGLFRTPSGSFSGSSYSLIQNATGANGFTVTNDLNSGINLLNVDPLLGTLANNGGPTETIALNPASPAIGAGDPYASDLSGPVTVDQRGVARKSSPDIGAFETTPLVLSQTPAGTLTLGDGNPLTDVAKVTGGINPTGTITFALVDPDLITVHSETVTVTGDGSYVTPQGYVPTLAGTYFWSASYSGDSNNSGSGASNGPEAVSAASPTLTATPGATTVTLSNASVTLQDTATLSDGFGASGTLTFTLYLGSTLVDTETDTVSGNGSYTTSTGYTLPTTGAVTGTYHWDVHYSGDTKNNAVSDNNANNEHVVVSAASPTLTATPSATTVTLSNAPVTLQDTATLSGGYQETGTLTFTLYLGSTLVDTETATVNGNGSYQTSTGYTLPTMGAVTGTYQWDVFYSGATNNNAVSDNNANNEHVVVSAASPALTATPSVTTVTLSNAPVTLRDTATLSGGYQETGTLTFTLFLGSTLVDTETATVNGDGGYQTSTGYTLPTTGAVMGTYQWDVSYSGATNNNAVSDNNANNEHVVVSAASPALEAAPTVRTVTLGTAPVTLQDKAELADGYHETGNLTFTLYLGSTLVHTETVPVSGDRIVYTTPTGYTLPATGTVAGTYQWDVSYSGDTNNNPISNNNASNEQETVNKANPTLGVTAGGPLVLGSGVKLTASATLAQGFSPTGAIAFSLTGPGGTIVHTELVSVNGDGVYSTSTGYPPTAAGAYHWTAAYQGDSNNNGVSTPNAALESVSPGTPTLTVNPVTIAYGTALANAQLSGTASFAGQTVAGLFTYTSAAGAVLNAGSAQTEAVTFTPTDTTDFTTATGQVTVTVNKAQLTVTPDPTSRAYGAANPSFTATVSGFVNGQTLATSGVIGSAAVSSTTTSTSPVGSYAITAALGTLAAANYSFTFAPGTLTITPHCFSYTIGNDVRTAGGPFVNLNRDLPATIPTGVNGENLTITCSSAGNASTANSGTYAITGTLANGTGLASNYNVTLVPGSLTVNPPISFTTTALPSWTINVSYSANIETTGGTGAVTFALTGGSLPTGLTLNPNGSISGVCAIYGTFTFTVTATDSLGATSSETLTMTFKASQGRLTIGSR